MKRCRNVGVALLAVALLGVGAAYAAKPKPVPTPEQVAACHQKATDDQQRQDCLEKELELVTAEHKDAVERVTVMAKAWDKPQRTKQRWEKFIRSSQSFETFVKRECDFVRFTTKGSRTKERNAELACRINHYRMHTDVLENRLLASER